MAAVPLFVLENERKRSYKQRTYLEGLSDYRVKEATGLPWWGVREIVEVFEPISTKIKSDIPLDLRVFTFLVHLRSGSFQYGLGLGSGISQPSVSRVLDTCRNFCVQNSKQFINFPETVDQVNASKQKFFEIDRFPNVLGLIDGTQIAIKTPKENEASFVCRKHFHSINTQVICGPDHLIYDLVAKWPGSTHDSFIYHNCGAKDRLYSGLLGEGYLLGDSGYPLEEKLLTPYLAETSEVHRRFNRRHRATRNAVERVIGTWKQRFRCIDRTGGSLCYNEEISCKVIIATAVLHNICVKKEIPLLEQDNNDLPQAPEEDVDISADIPSQAQVRRRGTAKRNEVAERLS